MNTLKFYFQTTLETIVTLLFIGVAIVATNYIAEPHVRHKNALDLKADPRVVSHDKYKEMGWEKKVSKEIIRNDFK